MCVIATKEVGYTFPDKETLRRCFTANPDGAGFAFSTKDKVFWKKGFLTFEAFYDALKEVFPTEKSEKLSACIMHFRIGTHGPKKSPTHTHPFPVDVDSIQKTCELEGSSEMVLFHNGIIYDMTKYKHDKVLVDGKPEEPSDSQILAQYFVNPMFKAWKRGIFKVSHFDNFMFSLIGTSKIALLGKGNQVIRYGTWAVEDTDFPGCNFSNTSYEKPKVITTYGKSSAWREGWSYDDYIDDYSDREDTLFNKQYWKAYNAYYKKYPKAHREDFLTYWKNLQKSETAQKETRSKKGTTIGRNEVLPFWETHSKHVFAGDCSHMKPLPEQSQVWVTAKEFITYNPSIDGEIYYWPMKRSSGIILREYLYVKEGSNLYFLGTYSFMLEQKEGGTLNAQTDIKLIESSSPQTIV